MYIYIYIHTHIYLYVYLHIYIGLNRTHVQLVVWRVVVHVLVPGHRVRNRLARQIGRLVGPAPGDVAHGVATAPQHQHRDAKAPIKKRIRG